MEIPVYREMELETGGSWPVKVGFKNLISTCAPGVMEIKNSVRNVVADRKVGSLNGGPFHLERRGRGVPINLPYSRTPRTKKKEA